MSILERLYSLEIEFHRLFRAEAISAVEAVNVHTSYALQKNYEPLLRMIGMSDPRDVRAAFHSLRQVITVD